MSSSRLRMHALPQEEEELKHIADKQVRHFLRKKRKKKEIAQAMRQINRETSDKWLRKHSGRRRPEELAPEELQAMYKWFTATVETFKSENGALQARKLQEHLLGLNIFEHKSQLVLFSNMLHLKQKKKHVLISFPEFSFALNGCGIDNFAMFQELVHSQQKKSEGIRHRNSPKLPLHVSAYAPSVSSKSNRIDTTSPMKRVTSKTPLVGGGVLYTCCPDVNTAASSQPKLSTVPAGMLPVSIPNQFKLTRERTSKKLPLHTDALNLPCVLQSSSPVQRSGKGPVFLGGPGSPEVDCENTPRPSTAACALTSGTQDDPHSALQLRSIF